MLNSSETKDKIFGFFLPLNLPKDFNVSVHYRIKINDNKQVITIKFEAKTENDYLSELTYVLPLKFCLVTAGLQQFA